jgi:hypothetical protein
VEIYAELGQIDRALQLLDSQYQRREGGLILLNAAPCCDVLKSDPRFQQLLQRIDLPHQRTVGEDVPGSALRAY